jgi:hypothetical protein
MKGKPMIRGTPSTAIAIAATSLATILLVGARFVNAHCDTLGGPVVESAKLALDQGDVTPVLRWVSPEHEKEIETVFEQVLAVRVLGPRARDIADAYFFETLVRIHREGEGAPYTGLKPADAVDPAVAMADQALENGSVDDLANALSTKVDAGVRARFAAALEAKKQADKSVEDGREFVETYVQFTHYVERLHQIAASGAEHHDDVH